MDLRKLILWGGMLGGLLGASVSYASVQEKKASLWGETFSYQLVILTKKNAIYDGKAFTVERGAKKIRRVVLNNAFFEKEGLELWNEFIKGTPPSLAGSPPLMEFLDKLKSFNGSEINNLVDQLTILKNQLQYASWYDVYQQAKGDKKKFVKQFVKLREETIEYHELSHLLDEIRLERRKGSTDEKFAQDTELRAFLTELVYGENPRDSLWQVVSGVLAEIKMSSVSDYSIHKLVEVLEATRTIPWVARGDELCFLCYLTPSHAQEVGNLAYQDYLHQKVLKKASS